MQEAYALASKSAQKAALKGRRQHGKRVRSTTLVPGDRVLVRNLTPRGGPGKIKSFWEDEIHVVVSRKPPDSPVYDVKPESGHGKIRTLHRNLLLPGPYLQTATPKISRMQQHKNWTPKQPTTSRKEVPSVESEGEEAPLFTPNQIRELVHLEAELEKNTNCTTNLEENVPTAEIPENLEENVPTVEMPENLEENVPTVRAPANVDETTPDQSVRPQRQRQPPLRLEYYAPGNSATWQVPDVGIIQSRNPWVPPIQHPTLPQTGTSLMNQYPMFPQQARNQYHIFPQQTMNQYPMFPQQVMNPTMSSIPMCYGIPPTSPFGFQVLVYDEH